MPVKTFLISALVALLVFAGGNTLSAQTGKRGLAYGHLSPEDMQALAPEVSWWYNWAIIPESSVASVYEDYGFEFVPMAWNNQYDEARLRAYLTAHPETKYILGFNEPNFLEQAKMTPSEAAAAWPRLEAIADEFNLEIVAPAVNYCGECVTENGTTYTDPFKYLDDFFAACPDCRVDHIAVHSYMNTVEALKWYIGRFEKYGKPIWLTEFAGWEENGNIKNVQDQINFMMGAVDYLESNPNVFRYAWFIGRYRGITRYPYIDLLGSNGQLTVLGEVYTQMPVHDINSVVEVPARIQAEEYNRMNGIQIELTADTSGFANVGYFDNSDWLEYKIDVPYDGSYQALFRVASTKPAVFILQVDGATLQTFSLPVTGGWQSWTTISSEVTLTQGVHTLRLQAITDGFNMNWFELKALSTSAENISHRAEKFDVYPNPGNGVFHIRSTLNIEKLQVMDLSGRILHTTQGTEHIDLSFLAPGIYHIKAFDSRRMPVAGKKIVIR